MNEIEYAAFERYWEEQAISFQPWLLRTLSTVLEQQIIQDVLRNRAGATFGRGCFVAREAKVFTSYLYLGDRQLHCRRLDSSRIDYYWRGLFHEPILSFGLFNPDRSTQGSQVLYRYMGLITASIASTCRLKTSPHV
jgi:hypothetical protein